MFMSVLVNRVINGLIRMQLVRLTALWIAECRLVGMLDSMCVNVKVYLFGIKINLNVLQFVVKIIE